MVANPVGFVKFALQLFKSNNINKSHCEIELRTVINRAYYGAFLVARDQAGIKNSSGSVHGAVISYYKNQKATKISNNLEYLKTLRQKADYELDQKIDLQQAKGSCRSARTILKELGFII